MKGLVEKLNKVMQELGAVPKEGKNQAQGYNYLAHADLVSKLHPLLIKNGLVMYPSDMQFESTAQAWTTKDGMERRQNRIVAKVCYTVTDGEYEIKVYGIGEGVDPQDKSSYKAQTGAHKYALKGLFCIPDELDAEEATPEEIQDAKVTTSGAYGKGAGANAKKISTTTLNSIKEYADSNIFTEAKQTEFKKQFNVKKFSELNEAAGLEIYYWCKAQETNLNGGK